MSINIFGVRIDNFTRAKLKSRLSESVCHDKLLQISKINSEFLQRAINDKSFVGILNRSNLNIVDGRGVLWAAKYLTIPVSSNKLIRTMQSFFQMIYSGASIVFYPEYIKYPIAEAIPGVEAFNLVMDIAQKENAGVFIFGSSEQTLTDAIKNIKNKFPNLIISGHLNGYDYQKESKINVVEQINNTNAKILIVALGSPKQEQWITDNANKLKNIRIAVGEGGTLDRIANPSQKAPKFINKIGLEWLWRLFFNASKTQTRNRFQRFWSAVPSFIYNILKWKIQNGQTKI